MTGDQTNLICPLSENPMVTLVIKNAGSDLFDPLTENGFCEEYNITSYNLSDSGDIEIQFVDQSDRFNYICDSHIEDFIFNSRAQEIEIDINDPNKR